MIKNTKTQFGRSIVEMLGVLVIIGILSLTAVWMIPTLMTHWKANEIVAQVVRPQIILTLSEKNLDQKPAGEMSFDVDTTPYQQYATFALEKTAEGFIKLSMDQLDAKLCQKIVEQLLPSQPDIHVSVNETNRLRTELCVLDKNRIDIYFPQDMTLPTPDTPTCDKTPCGENFVCDSATNTCVCNQLLDTFGQCHSCATTNNVASTQSACDQCASRVYHDGVCYAPCDANSIRGDNYACYSCTQSAGITNVDQSRCLQCIGNRFWNVSANTCWSCQDMAEYPSDTGLGCLECGNRFFGTDKINTQRKLCVNCDSDVIRLASIDSCANCGQKRIYVAETGECLKRKCSNTEFLGKDNQCHSCQEVGFIAAYENECFRCDNRYSPGSSCGRCEDMKTISNANKANCDRCPNATFFNGQCYPCKIEDAWTSTKEQCAACPNRVFSTNDKLSFCHLPCSANMIYSLNTQKCVSCDQMDGISAGGKDACLSICGGKRFWNVSANTCWSCNDPVERRSDEDNGCHTCANRFLRSAEKNGRADYCAPCNLNNDVFAPEDFCNRCPTRFYRKSDGKCLKPCASGTTRQADGSCV